MHFRNVYIVSIILCTMFCWRFLSLAGNFSVVKRVPTVTGLLLALIAGLLADEQPEGKPNYRQAVVIRLDGPISSRLEQFVYRKINRARREEADLVVIEIDSPGGELEASLNLAQHLRDLDWAHVVAYVPVQALSGAAIAALGCDEIVMRPQAVFGDAGPIVMDFIEFGFRHAPEKIQTDLARRVRDLAESRGRSAGLAEAMVDKNLIVYRVQHEESGEQRFMTDAEIDADMKPEQWKKLNLVLESRDDKFLEVSGRRGVELGLADAIVVDKDELWKRFGLRERPLVFDRQLVDVAVDSLNSPWITTLLFVIGLIAVFIELSAPGISVGGLIALLCFALFFWSRFLGGTAGWVEVALFLSGIAFLLAEIFVLPGFGVPGVGGILLITSSLIMAGQDFILPNSGTQLTTLLGTVTVVLGSLSLAFAAVLASTLYFGKIPILNWLALRLPNTEFAEKTLEELLPTATPAHHLLDEKQIRVGDIGIASSTLRPAGVVQFGNESQDVVSEGTYVEEGNRVQVIRIMGNRIVVRGIDDR